VAGAAHAKAVLTDPDGYTEAVERFLAEIAPA
jgi:hypothetical protein